MTYTTGMRGEVLSSAADLFCFPPSGKSQNRLNSLGEKTTWQLANQFVLLCLAWPSMTELVITSDPGMLGFF